MPGARNSVSASSTTSCGRCSASTALIWSASLATPIIAPSSTTISPSSTNSMRPARRAFAWTKRPRTANFGVESAAILFSSAAMDNSAALCWMFEASTGDTALGAAAVADGRWQYSLPHHTVDPWCGAERGRGSAPAFIAIRTARYVIGYSQSVANAPSTGSYLSL